jgi:type IV pilus assembly protein PilB
VFSTLHTNDVWGVFPRLMDLGVSFESIKHTVVGIVSQRLVRKVCECSSQGCIKCDQTSFFGRMAIAEILAITPELRHYLNGSHGVQIPQDILSNAYISLRSSGDEAIHNQLTTKTEVSRHCGEV